MGRLASQPCDANSTGVMQRFSWQTICGRPDAAPLPIRTVLAARQTVPLHDHAFAEVSWIEAGSGTDRDGRGLHVLETGMLLLHGPDDPHTLQAGPQGLVLINVILAMAEVAATLRQWGLPPATWSGHHRIQGCDGATIAAAAASLVAGPDDPLRRGSVLLATLAALRPVAQPRFAACPSWLADACLRMEHPENFTAGVARLVALAGRSREHVGRELRRHAGMTPRMVVSTARLQHAAALLATTATPATAIALECGWTSVAGFYAAFRREFGLSPQAWRRRATRVPIVPLQPLRPERH